MHRLVYLCDMYMWDKEDGSTAKRHVCSCRKALKYVLSDTTFSEAIINTERTLICRHVLLQNKQQARPGVVYRRAFLC